MHHLKLKVKNTVFKNLKFPKIYFIYSQIEKFKIFENSIN